MQRLAETERYALGRKVLESVITSHIVMCARTYVIALETANSTTEAAAMLTEACYAWDLMKSKL